jgi:TetR/AcrR family transcriptional regulator, regulator of autoinduction and epiphytic fitness
VSRPELSYRQRQAQATRERIAVAARSLFRKRGFLATTIEAIAKEAGVAEPTVYASYGSKRAILEEIRRIWIRESGVVELSAQALGNADLVRRVELGARMTRQQLERGYDVIAVYQDAARADPAMTKVWAKVLRQRDQQLTRFIASLEPGLAPGVDVKTALDLFLALGRPEVYRELVVDRGWSASRYEQWLATSLKQQLLGAGT